jgi:hypothetical protein
MISSSVPRNITELYSSLLKSRKIHDTDKSRPLYLSINRRIYVVVHLSVCMVPLPKMKVDHYICRLRDEYMWRYIRRITACLLPSRAPIPQCPATLSHPKPPPPSALPTTVRLQSSPGRPGPPPPGLAPPRAASDRPPVTLGRLRPLRHCHRPSPR